MKHGYPSCNRATFTYVAGLSICLTLIAGSAVAATDSDVAPEVQFEQAAAAVERGAFSEALLRLERLSDNGFVHPDASFNRGLAYLQRAESTQAQPGDRGQAVAAFLEAVALSDDADAQRLVSATRQEISRNRAARGKDPVVVAPPLGRAVSGLFTVSTWAVLSLGASLLLSAALLVRASAHSTRRLIADIVAWVSGGLLALCGSLYALAYHYESTSRDAVVVVENATLRDSQGKPLLARALDTDSADVPEGARVFVISRSGRLVQVQWGGSQAWLRDTELRVLARPGT